MILVRREHDVTVWSPAKLNLFLEVLGKRSDGFHEIETLISAVNIYDTIHFTATPTPEIDFDSRWCAGMDSSAMPPLPPGQQNLVVRALEELRRQANRSLGARVRLIKRIPMEAGMGGGSSNAAATLWAGNLVWRLGMAHAQLRQIAAGLGSDVPFFLSGSPAICRGRGEEITPLRPLGHQHFVIAKPNIGLSTAAVYAACRIPREPVPCEPGRLFNRLQDAALELSTEVSWVRDRFDEMQLRHHQLTGSGAAYFGVCSTRKQALQTAARLRQRGMPNVWVAQSHRGLSL